MRSWRRVMLSLSSLQAAVQSGSCGLCRAQAPEGKVCCLCCEKLQLPPCTGAADFGGKARRTVPRRWSLLLDAADWAESRPWRLMSSHRRRWRQSCSARSPQRLACAHDHGSRGIFPYTPESPHLCPVRQIRRPRPARPFWGARPKAIA